MSVAFSPSSTLVIDNTATYSGPGTGVPGWVETGATVDLDFAGRRHFWNGTTSLSQALIVSRSGGTALAFNRDGTWSSYGPNLPRIGIGMGLLKEPVTIARLLNNSNFAAASWTNSGVTLADSGITPMFGGVTLKVILVPPGTTSLAIPVGVSTIDVYGFGPGGNGAAGVVNVQGGGGGGAGAFASQLNIPVTGGTTIAVQVPLAGSQQPFFVKNNAGTIVCQGDFGSNAVGIAGGAGGLVVNCVGSISFAGGTAGSSSAGTSRGGAGGGGRPLPLLLSGLPSNYSGRTGASGNVNGGGGGATNSAPLSGTAGGAAAGLGGDGAANAAGTAGGAGGTPTTAAGNGVDGSGGAGGSTGVGINGGNGGNMAGSVTYGSNVTPISTATSSGGGGGGLGGNGGNGGGGGGGGGCSPTAAGTGGTGGDAYLLVAYGSSTVLLATATAPGAYLSQTYSPVNVAYTGSIVPDGAGGGTMTVTSSPGGVSLLSVVGGAAPHTTIRAQLNGTIGGPGDYTVSVPQTLASTSLLELINRCPSLVVMPKLVTGAIWLSQDGGVTQTDITPQFLSGRFEQAFIPYDALAVCDYRITFQNAGNSLYLGWAQLEDHIYPTSPIPSGVGVASRGTDFVLANVAAFPPIIASDTITVLQPVRPGPANAGIGGLYYSTAWTWCQIWGQGPPIATFTGSIAGNIMTVTGTVTGYPLEIYAGITGPGVSPGTQIFLQHPGGTPGGAGTYSVFPSQTVASATLTSLDTSSYTANAVEKPPLPGEKHTGVTVVRSSASVRYGFDPQHKFYNERTWSRAAYTMIASQAKGWVALDGDVEASTPQPGWSDPSTFTTLVLGSQMPGGLTTLVGYTGRFTVLVGASAYSSAQLATWSAKPYP